MAAVLGWPVGHTRSPALHNAAFIAADVDAVFVALPVAPPDLAAVVRGLAAVGALGASVTVPHKQAVMALCDHVEPPADRVGAVNCLAFEGGAGQQRGSPVIDERHHRGSAGQRGQRHLLGQRVVAGVVERGAGRVDQQVGAGQLGGQLGPRPRVAPGGRGRSAGHHHHRGAGVGQSGGDRAGRAADRGHPVGDGAAMLLHQGARAFTLWTGKPAPLDVMRAALLASL